MSSNFLRTVKMYMPNVYANGDFVEKPKIFYAGREIPEEVSKFMRETIHFFLESNFLRPITKQYLVSPVVGVRAFVDSFNTMHGEEEQIPYDMARNATQYDKRKVTKIFGDDVLEILIADTELVKEYNDKLYEAMTELATRTPQARALAFPVMVDAKDTKLDDERFNELLYFLNKYSVRRLKTVGMGKSKEISKESLEYFGYLISTRILTDKEKERIKMVNNALGIDEGGEENVKHSDK